MFDQAKAKTVGVKAIAILGNGNDQLIIGGDAEEVSRALTA